MSCHQPANRSSACRDGISTADSHREYPGDHRQHRQPLRRPDLPEPDRQRDVGNQKSHCAISPAAYAVRLAGSGGRYAGRSSATRPDSTPDRPVPADPLRDHRRRHRRIRRQQLPELRLDPSTTDPGRRSYFGGPSLAIAARTVFLDTPSPRAIA